MSNNSHHRVGLGHVLRVPAGHLFIRRDPVEASIRRGEVAVGRHIVIDDDSPHGPSLFVCFRNAIDDGQPTDL